MRLTQSFARIYTSIPSICDKKLLERSKKILSLFHRRNGKKGFFFGWVSMGQPVTCTGWANPSAAEAFACGNQKGNKNTLCGFFLSHRPTAGGQHNYVLSHCLHSKAWPNCVYRCCPLVITCTARHGQNEIACAGPRSLLARRGMVRLS